MVNNYSYTECDLLGFYLLGRWNVFLDNSVAFQVEKIVYRIFMICCVILSRQG